MVWLNFITLLGSVALLVAPFNDSATSTENPPLIRVLCYNIHHANPPSKEAGFIDLDAIATVINDQRPDVVALQEVDVHVNRSGNVDQARVLAEKTGMKAYYFGKAIDHDGGEYGVAILSRFDIDGMQTVPLPANVQVKSEPRVLATAIIRMPQGVEFLFGVTHLEVGDEITRTMQVEAISAFAAENALPMIVAGDFNAYPGSETIQLLDKTFKRTCDDCEPTIPVINPTQAIDFIAFSPKETFRVIQHKVISETYASDHLPVFAELAFRP